MYSESPSLDLSRPSDAVRITRVENALTYSPPEHDGVAAYRLQGHEAGPTERFWVGLSVYTPGGCAATSPTAEETVYVVLDGELTLEVDSEATVLHRHDSVRLAKGTVRRVENRGTQPATLLVTIALPAEPAESAENADR
jgi:mannose-6-phosphate isomerase-like protein (cupin superfamily)